MAAGSRRPPTTTTELAGRIPRNARSAMRNSNPRSSACTAKSVRSTGRAKGRCNNRREGVAVACCTVERLMAELGRFADCVAARSNAPWSPTPSREPGDVVGSQIQPKRAKYVVGSRFHVSVGAGGCGVHEGCVRPADRGLAHRDCDDFTAGSRRHRARHLTRQREGREDLTGLIHHYNRGSQHTSIAFADGLLEAGNYASTGTTGNSYDNAPSRNHRRSLQDRTDQGSRPAANP